MITFLVVSTLVCHSVPAVLKPKPKPSIEQTFKRRWLAIHFRELAK